MRFPGGLGVALVVALVVTLNVFINGETEHGMEAMAAKQVGSGYQLHVTSLSISNPGQNESVSGRDCLERQRGPGHSDPLGKFALIVA
jgi:hypothetical protein